MMTSVCVIGAGAAGLCAARHLSALGIHVRVFEQSNVVGGTWVYTDQVGKDSRGFDIHSSMYERLMTNLPKEIMAFPDYPFPPGSGEGTSSFIHHTEVRKYLENYCDNFGLRKHIRFGTRVDSVVPESYKWRVGSARLAGNAGGKGDEELFDAIIVCNGHYSVPNVPPIEGMEKFKGSVLHSHDYRRPADERFAGKVVVLLGAAASGIDISLEVAETAKRTLLSHNNQKLASKLPDNLEQVSGIVSCLGDRTFLLADGCQIYDVDTVIFCTGYEYTFPFLPEGLVSVDNRRLRPLYKHMIHSERPSLFFIGIPLQVLPFPFFDLQIRCACKVISGNHELPSSREMELDTEREMNARKEEGVAERHFHKFGPYQWRYLTDLAETFHVEGHDKAKERLYEFVSARRRKIVMSYKKESYKLGPDGENYVLDQ